MPIQHLKVGPQVTETTLLRGSLPEFGWNGLAIHKAEGVVRALAGGSGEVKWTARF